MGGSLTVWLVIYQLHYQALYFICALQVHSKLVIEFFGQKLSRLHQICSCNWIFWSKTLSFASNLWLWLSFLVKNSLVYIKFMAVTEFSGQKLSFTSNLWLWLSFLVKNSLFYIKFMAVTEFSGQKLSRLHQIYGCDWVFWSKTLSFTTNLWL